MAAMCRCCGSRQGWRPAPGCDIIRLHTNFTQTAADGRKKYIPPCAYRHRDIGEKYDGADTFDRPKYQSIIRQTNRYNCLQKVHTQGKTVPSIFSPCVPFWLCVPHYWRSLFAGEDKLEHSLQRKKSSWELWVLCPCCDLSGDDRQRVYTGRELWLFSLLPLLLAEKSIQTSRGVCPGILGEAHHLQRER